MTDTLTTLRASLDALERALSFFKDDYSGVIYHYHVEAITDLRTLIAAIEKQEPDAYLSDDKERAITATEKKHWIDSYKEYVAERYTTPLYLYPAQPVEQPVLTDDEIDSIVLSHMEDINSSEGNPVRKLNAYRSLVRAGSDIRSKQA